MRISRTVGARSSCAFARASESCGSSAARSFSWTLLLLEFFFPLPPSSCSLCRVTGSLARQCRSLLKSQTFFGGWKRASWFCLGDVTWAGSHLQDSGGSGVCWWLAFFPSSAPPTAPGAGRNRTRFKLQTATFASSTSPSRSAAAHGRVCFLRETCCKKEGDMFRVYTAQSSHGSAGLWETPRR